MKQPQKPSSSTSGSEAQPSADVLAAAKRLPETDWRHFPQFEHAFESSDSRKDIFSKIEKTCQQLEQFRIKGSAREKTRAQAAMRAYGRTVELVRHLDELRAARPEQT